MGNPTRTMVEVEHVATDADSPLHPLYHRYPQQTQTQGAYIRLGCASGRLSTYVNPEIGNATPMDVYHGHTRTYRISCYTPPAEINRLLDEIAPLAQRVLDGYSVEWDGRNDVAWLTEDAEAAEEEIIRVCEASDEAVADMDGGVWAVGDWLSPVSAADLGITADTTDEQIETRAEELESEARGENITLDGGDETVEDYLRNLRQELRDEREEASWG